MSQPADALAMPPIEVVIGLKIFRNMVELILIHLQVHLQVTWFLLWSI